MFYRATPFANGASDNPDGILKRIGEGNLKMESGNWLSVSSEAKVTLKKSHFTPPSSFLKFQTTLQNSTFFGEKKIQKICIGKISHTNIVSFLHE